MNEIPLGIFITVGIILFALLYLIFRTESPVNLVCGIICVMISFFLSKTAINGTLVMTFGGITSTDTVITGNAVIQNSTLGWIFSFIALISFGLVIKMLINEIGYQMKPVLEDSL